MNNHRTLIVILTDGSHRVTTWNTDPLDPLSDKLMLSVKEQKRSVAQALIDATVIHPALYAEYYEGKDQRRRLSSLLIAETMKDYAQARVRGDL